MKNKISQVGTPTRNFPLYYSTNYFLNIEGGSGHGKKYQGGTYAYVAAYLNPSQEEYRVHFGNRISCLGAFCQSSGIKFWHADTLPELIEQIKDVTIDDITTLNDPVWVEFKEKEDRSKKHSLENQIKIWKNRIIEAKSYKNAIRKDGNYRKDIQKRIDRCNFEIESAERELGIYEPELV